MEFDDHDTPTTNGTPDDRPSRRDALTKLGVAAAVAWTAPVVVTMAAPAAAASNEVPISTPPCRVCGQELVVNGSFEDFDPPSESIPLPGGLFPGWTTPIGFGLYQQGDYAADLKVPPPGAGPTFGSTAAPGTLCGFTQTIDLDAGCAGQPFSLHFWWEALGNANDPELTVRFEGSDGSADVDIPLTTPGEMTIPGTVPTGTTAVVLRWQLLASLRFSVLNLDVVSFIVGC